MTISIGKHFLIDRQACLQIKAAKDHLNAGEWFFVRILYSVSVGINPGIIS